MTGNYAFPHPTLSPDGRWLAIREWTGGNGSSTTIIVHDLDKHEKFVVHEDDGVTEWNPRFDGRSNLWLWTDKGNGMGQLLTMDLAGGARTEDDAVQAIPEHPELLLESYTLIEDPTKRRPTRVAAVMADREQIRQLWIREQHIQEPTLVLEGGRAPVRDEGGRHLGYSGGMSGLVQDPDDPGLVLMNVEDIVSPDDVVAVDVNTGAVVYRTDHAETLRRRLPMPTVDGLMYTTTLADGTAVPNLVMRPAVAAGSGGVSSSDPAEAAMVSSFYGAFKASTPLTMGRLGGLAGICMALGVGWHQIAPRGGAASGLGGWMDGHAATYRNTLADVDASERDLVTRGLARPERMVRVGLSAAAMDIVYLAVHHPENVAGSLASVPAAGLLNPDMWGNNGRVSEYGDPRKDLELLAERDPVVGVINTMTPEQAAKLGLVCVISAVNDDRVVPNDAVEMVAALQDRLRDTPDAGPALLAQTNGGHAFDPSHSEAVVFGVAMDRVGGLALVAGGRAERIRSALEARRDRDAEPGPSPGAATPTEPQPAVWRARKVPRHSPSAVQAPSSAVIGLAPLGGFGAKPATTTERANRARFDPGPPSPGLSLERGRGL